MANLDMIDSVESTVNGFLMDEHGNESLAHCFMPMSTTWNAINYQQQDDGGILTDKYPNVWEEEQAVEWMDRVLAAGGAWTWNIPRASNEPDTLSLLRADFVEFCSKVVAQLSPTNTTATDEHGSDNVDSDNICIASD